MKTLNKIKNIHQNNKNWGTPRRTASSGTWCFSIKLAYRKMCTVVKRVGAFKDFTASCHLLASYV